MRRPRNLTINDAASAEAVADLENRSQRKVTPCGDEQLVWHTWGSGAPVLLSHGGSGSWTHWFRVIPALAERYHVIVPDLPGLGDSAMPDEPQTPQHSAQILVSGFRELFKNERTHVVGFSYGGQVATLSAELLGDQVMSLTLIGVAALGLLRAERPAMASIREGMSQDEVIAAHRHNLEILMFHDPARIDALALYIQAENVRRARFESRPFALTDTIGRTLANVRAPLRAIYGEKDIVALPSLADRFVALAKHHPELVHRTIPGCGHWVMYEGGDVFNRALLELLAHPAK